MIHRTNDGEEIPINKMTKRYLHNYISLKLKSQNDEKLFVYLVSYIIRFNSDDMKKLLMEHYPELSGDGELLDVIRTNFSRRNFPPDYPF